MYPVATWPIDATPDRTPNAIEIFCKEWYRAVLKVPCTLQVETTVAVATNTSASISRGFDKVWKIEGRSDVSKSTESVTKKLVSGS